MSVLKHKIKMEMFILLIFKDLVESLWILKENKIFHSFLTPDKIYLKNGYFKLGGYEFFLNYGTRNALFKNQIEDWALPFMPPEYFLNKVTFYPS